MKRSNRLEIELKHNLEFYQKHCMLKQQEINRLRSELAKLEMTREERDHSLMQLGLGAVIGAAAATAIAETTALGAITTTTLGSAGLASAMLGTTGAATTLGAGATIGTLAAETAVVGATFSCVIS